MQYLAKSGAHDRERQGWAGIEVDEECWWGESQMWSASLLREDARGCKHGTTEIQSNGERGSSVTHSRSLCD